MQRKKIKALQQQEINIKTKPKSSQAFIRQDAVNGNGKPTSINRDLSDEVDLERHGSTS